MPALPMPSEADLAAFLSARAAGLLAARQFDRLYLSAFVTVGAACPAPAVEFAVSPDQLPVIFSGPTLAAALQKYDDAHGPAALLARARRLRAEAAHLESRYAGCPEPVERAAALESRLVPAPTLPAP